MDVATFQKNAALQQAKAKTRIQNQLMKNLVPVARQLEMARSFDFPQVHSKKQATFLRNLNQNLLLVYETFLGTTGLTEIAPNVGDAFNETTESAQGLMYAPNQPPNSVLRAVWKGYMFEGEILQRAEVILSTDNPDHPNILQPDARQESGEKMGWRARLRKIFTNNPNSKI
jgi:molecular chaperone GrpE (heat shock protein)